MFPFEENVFHECLLLAVRNIIKIKNLYICGNQVEDLYETPSFLWLPGVAGPKFDIETRKVSAAVIEYESSQAFNFNYQEIHNFYTEVKLWFFLLKCTLTCFKLEFLKNTELVSYMTLVADQPKKAFVSNFFFSLINPLLSRSFLRKALIYQKGYLASYLMKHNQKFLKSNKNIVIRNYYTF